MKDRGKHCKCKGCRDYSTSNQPVAIAMSKVLHSHHNKEKKSNQLESYSRKIQESWYKKYTWITVCSFQYRIFCRLCCDTKQQELLTDSDHTKSPFINNGFANQKKVLQRFSEHKQSDIHHAAVEKLAAKTSSVHILALLSSIKATEMVFHRRMFMKVLSCIRNLGRQGLALQGHDENIENFEGNLYQGLLLETARDDKMKAWLYKKQYLSPVITNEMINIMGITILESILTTVMLRLQNGMPSLLMKLQTFHILNKYPYQSGG